MGHSPGIPCLRALEASWGPCCGDLRCRVHRQGFPPATRTSLLWGKCHEEEPRGPKGNKEGEIGRVHLTLDFPLPAALPICWREMRALVSLDQRPC